MYNKHDESLRKFARLFNGSKDYRHIQIRPNTEETYDNDGQIVNTYTGQEIGFDWEYRDRYFENCNFRFKTLGQYERKLIKPSIKISIQCDSTETGIAIAWHEDWLSVSCINRRLATDSNDEWGTVRYTKHFRVYSYDNIRDFKEMLDRAFKSGNFNKHSF